MVYILKHLWSKKLVLLQFSPSEYHCQAIGYVLFSYKFSLVVVKNYEYHPILSVIPNPETLSQELLIPKE